MSPIVVLITAGSPEEAHKIANLLVEEKLAACVQILPPMESVYRWQGKIERATEVLLIAKALAQDFVALEARVRGMHSYETPEVVAIPIAAISEPYLRWLLDVTGEASR